MSVDLTPWISVLSLIVEIIALSVKLAKCRKKKNAKEVERTKTIVHDNRTLMFVRVFVFEDSEQNGQKNPRPVCRWNEEDL